MSLLRSRAVNFDEKWDGLRDTIGRVVRLQTEEMTKWNDHYSYPPPTITCRIRKPLVVQSATSVKSGVPVHDLQPSTGFAAHLAKYKLIHVLYVQTMYPLVQYCFLSGHCMYAVIYMHCVKHSLLHMLRGCTLRLRATSIPLSERYVRYSMLSPVLSDWQRF